MIPSFRSCHEQTSQQAHNNINNATHPSALEGMIMGNYFIHILHSTIAPHPPPLRYLISITHFVLVLFLRGGSSTTHLLLAKGLSMEI